MNPAVRDAWLAEMWRPCRELPLSERLKKRAADAIAQAAMTERNPVDDVWSKAS